MDAAPSWCKFKAKNTKGHLKMLIKISSYHGLELNEWFSVFINSIISYLINENFDKAKELFQNNC